MFCCKFCVKWYSWLIKFNGGVGKVGVLVVKVRVMFGKGKGWAVIVLGFSYCFFKW